MPISFKETLEKIESSEFFKKFKLKNPKAKLCAGFFIIDLIGNNNVNSLDYKLGNKIFTFEVKSEERFENNKNYQVIIKEDKLMDLPPESIIKQQIQEIKLIPNIDLNELKTTAELKLIDNNISSKIQKIIAILQNYKGIETKNRKKIVWNLTCILDSLSLIHIMIDSENGKVLKFEKRSLMDMFKKS